MAGVKLLSAFNHVAKQASPSLRGYFMRQNFSSSAAMLSRVHLKSEARDGVGIVRFDSPNSKVNTLGTAVMGEFLDVMQELQQDSNVKSIVLISGKPGCFIAGADVAMIQACKSAEEVAELSRTGHQQMQSLVDSKKPVVAAIMGSCLGAGLETALACHYRVAMKHPKTALGLPEVMLGILPGAGGTQRLPQTVSLTNAFDMMLTGRQIRADRAKKMGLVDQLVEPLGPGLKEPELNSLGYLEEVAVGIAKGLADGTVKKPVKKKALMDKIMDFILKYPQGKNYVFGQVKGRVMKQSGGLYPAPLKIIDIVRTTLDNGSKAGYEAEAKGFGELAMTTESHALMGLFHGQTACKKNAFGKPERRVETVGVLGAGLMGAGIVQVSIDKGMKVIMKDMATEGLMRGQQQIEGGLKDAVKKKKVTSFQKDQILSNLDATLTYENFRKCDMVIEAVFEDINIKHKVIKEVEKHIRDDCIFASNTSALPITQIAEASSRPEKVIGMHYFSPVDKMALMEIITTEKTSQDTIASAVDVSLRQGKTVIVVKDSPGFYTTRCIAAMFTQVFVALQEGMTPTKLDKLTKSIGFPVGSATLFDEVGIDVGIHVGQYMRESFGPRFGTTAPLDAAREMAAKGHLGRKTGKGMYLYTEGSKARPENPETLASFEKYRVEPKMPLTDENVKDRLLLRFVNEAVRCYEEGILRNAAEGDIGLVFGLGFPPNLGGPFRYVDTVGAGHIVKRLDEFAAIYGEVLEPCQLLRDMAKDPSRKFHTK